MVTCTIVPKTTPETKEPPFEEMFVLFHRQEVVKVPADNLHIDTPINSILDREINSQYCNRVISGQGLAIALWDIIGIGEPVLFTGEHHVCFEGI